MYKLSKEEILEKAKSILKLEEKEHVKICVSAGICPECGESLHVKIIKTSMSVGVKYYHCDFRQRIARTKPSLT